MPVDPKTPDASPEPLTDAAKEAKARFEAGYRKLLDDVRSKVAFTILVWGPNPATNSPAAKKRVQIREALLADGHYAIFSEDVPDLPEASPFSEKGKEFAQLSAADMAIILVEDAPGASAEAHDFVGYLQFAPKCFVLIPTKYEAGYSAKGALRELQEGFGGVHWYEPDDLDSCKVLSAAIARVDARRQIIYRQRFG